MEQVDPEKMLEQLRAKGVKVARYIDSAYIDGRAVRHNFEDSEGRPVTWLVSQPTPDIIFNGGDAQ
jgi:hypothetical protein